LIKRFRLSHVNRHTLTANLTLLQVEIHQLLSLFVQLTAIEMKVIQNEVLYNNNVCRHEICSLLNNLLVENIYFVLEISKNDRELERCNIAYSESENVISRKIVQKL